MKFARIVFLVAALYGMFVTLPLFFMEDKFNIEYPPVITHPEYYYSFAGIVMVCQFLFLAVAIYPSGLRAFMLFGVFEKLSLLPAFIILFPQGRFPTHWILLFIIDLTLGILFLASYFASRPAAPQMKVPSG